MFGTNHSTVAPQDNNRPQAGTVAKTEGNLTYLFITGQGADSIYAFHNGQVLSGAQIESLSVNIEAPGENKEGVLTAVLTRYETGTGGERTTKSASLFPGVVDIVANGKRITVVCAEAGSFDGLALRVGNAPILDEQGVLTTGLPVLGVQTFRLTVAAPNLVDARLVWVEDGREDVILP